MREGRADLHTHTTASDGTNRPAVNVELAKRAGLSAVAITDHDTVAGIAEAVEAGRKHGIDVVPGVEISTVADSQEIHILGYGINIDDSVLRKRLQQLRDTRNRRNELIMERLADLKLPLTMDEVVGYLAEPLGPDETVGRPHIAQAMVRKGYVGTIKEAFDRYLAQGGPAYASVPRVHPDEAIQWIIEAGGAPVLAHPGIYKNDELAARIAASGVVGIEAYHSDHTAEDEARYEAWASQHGLIVTGGSDYHGERNGVVFHGELGSRTVAADVVAQLEQAAQAVSRMSR